MGMKVAAKIIKAPMPSISIEPESITLSSVAIENILEALGKQFVPPNLDRQRLASELQYSAEEYRRSVRRAELAPDRKSRLKKISKAARQIRALLNDDICDWIAQHRRTGHLFYFAEDEPTETDARKVPDDEDVRKTMERFIEAVDSFLKSVIDGDRTEPPDLLETKGGDIKSFYHGERSRFERLAGIVLPEVFRDHFAVEPRFSRRFSDNEAEGPFVRFAHKALIELGIRHNGREYSKHSIVTALSNARRNVVRR
jgi:hypothetical protein